MAATQYTGSVESRMSLRSRAVPIQEQFQALRRDRKLRDRTGDADRVVNRCRYYRAGGVGARFARTLDAKWICVGSGHLP